MKFPDVEALTQSFPRAFAEFHDLELPDHVGGRLTWIHDVALDRFPNVPFWIWCVGLQPFNRLFARPALVMNTGVHDQPRRTP